MDTDFVVEEYGRTASLYGDLEFTNTSRFSIDGNPSHVHTMCSNKAVIMKYPETRVREVVNRWELPAATDDLITTEDELFAKLAAVYE